MTAATSQSRLFRLWRCSLWIGLGLITLSCGSGSSFSEGTPAPEPEPLTCPDSADCSAQDCGLDPVCGLSCGECNEDATCSSEGQCCVPLTCSELQLSCGTADDGCGGLLECGLCDAGLECLENEAGGQSCSCPRLGPGDSGTVDIRPTSLALETHLDGAALTTENTSEEAYGSLMLMPMNAPTGVGWNRTRVKLYDPDAEAPHGSMTLPMLAGAYRLFYRYEGGRELSDWPINGQARIDDQITLPGESSIDIDLRTSVVDVEIRVDGQALDDTELLEGQVISVELEGLDGRARLAHLVGGDPAASWQLDQARLLLGSYRGRWSNNLGQGGQPVPFGYSSSLPLGGGTLDEQITIEAGTESIVIDVPSVLVQLGLTQNGSSPLDLGAASGDEPRIVLWPRSDGQPSAGPPESLKEQDRPERSPLGQGDPTDYPNAPEGAGQNRAGAAIRLSSFVDAASGLIADSIDVRIIEGNYDLIYQSRKGEEDPLDGLERRWAVNSVLLADNQPLYDSANLSWDLPAETVSVDLTLMGQALDPALCEGGEGRVRIKPSQPTPSDFLLPWTLPQVCDPDSGTPRLPYDLKLVSGNYDLHYFSVGSPPSPWPRHRTEVQLDLSRSVSSAAPLQIDIPSVTLSLDLSSNGAPLPAREDEPTDSWPVIQLADPALASPSHLGWSRAPTASLLCGPELESLPMIPGDYVIEYLAKDQAMTAPWPTMSYRVRESFDLTDDSSLSLDLVASEVEIRLALDGLPASDDNTSEDDYGKLVLVRAGPQGTFNYLSSWATDELPGDYRSLRLLPGHYQLLYYPGSHGMSSSTGLPAGAPAMNWPLTTGLYAGCLEIE